MRYTADGSPDTSFDGDAIVLTSSGIGDHFFNLAMGNDGRYVVAGSVDGDFLVSRYLPDGAVDTGFDGDGRAVTAFAGVENDLAMDVVVGVDDRILAVGATGAIDFFGITTAKFALAAYHDDGTLDTGFDGDGRVVTDITTGLGAAADGIRAAVLDSGCSPSPDTAARHTA